MADRNSFPRASKIKVTRADGSVVYQQARGRRQTIASVLQREVFARDGLCCRYCGFKRSSAERFHIDHVVPASKGGCDETSNLVVACQQCNSLKGTATWVPLTIEQAQGMKQPLKPLVVLRVQGLTTAQASRRLATRARMRRMPKETLKRMYRPKGAFRT